MYIDFCFLDCTRCSSDAYSLCVYGLEASWHCQGVRSLPLQSLYSSCQKLHFWFHSHTHNRFMAPWTLSKTTRVSRYQKDKTSLDLLEQEIVSDSGISLAICKSAPWPRHITTPASHTATGMAGWREFVHLMQNRAHSSVQLRCGWVWKRCRQWLLKLLTLWMRKNSEYYTSMWNNS